jgi:hypothetical protein
MLTFGGSAMCFRTPFSQRKKEKEHVESRRTVGQAVISIVVSDENVTVVRPGSSETSGSLTSTTATFTPRKVVVPFSDGDA